MSNKAAFTASATAFGCPQAVQDQFDAEIGKETPKMQGTLWSMLSVVLQMLRAANASNLPWNDIINLVKLLIAGDWEGFFAALQALLNTFKTGTAHGFRALLPAQHHADFDNALAALPEGEKAAVGGRLIDFINLLRSMGLKVNFGCLVAVIPQIIAGFSNPALLLAAFQAYIACAHQPTPTP